MSQVLAATMPGDPAPQPRDVYNTPGFHHVNGRDWFTTCEPYSQTVRCRTDIIATTVVLENGEFVSKKGWTFNNLTYLPLMTRAQWAHNPLGHTGSWMSDGRGWRTECDTEVSGRNGCRSYVRADVVAATATPSGGYTYAVESKWVFNNIVRFKS